MQTLNVASVMSDAKVTHFFGGGLKDTQFIMHLASKTDGNRCTCPIKGGVQAAGNAFLQGQGIVRIFTRSFSWASACYCMVEFVFFGGSARNFVQYDSQGRNSHHRWNPLKFVEVLFDDTLPYKASLTDHPTSGGKWPNCKAKGSDPEKVKCLMDMMADSPFAHQIGNPRVVAFDTGLSTGYMARSGDAIVAVVGDAARKSYNQLGIGINSGLRHTKDFLRLVMEAANADGATHGNTDTAITDNAALIAKAASHLTDMAQQRMYTTTSCHVDGRHNMVVMGTEQFTLDYQTPQNTIDAHIHQACAGLGLQAVAGDLDARQAAVVGAVAQRLEAWMNRQTIGALAGAPTYMWSRSTKKAADTMADCQDFKELAEFFGSNAPDDFGTNGLPAREVGVTYTQINTRFTNAFHNAVC